ncbi:hypothetical protein SAMN06265221_1772 [Paracoccus laeviglucosivorans]|uniref:Uncharacterized protein n=1 Tax=Paracoccus laeviglucosivorans TaxID=1197861 RepID=A0A521FVG7_9RHOB|nr:hypothetical protein SAMN06265221_1772 [Paracoccus laeviglucosivorans]
MEGAVPRTITQHRSLSSDLTVVVDPRAVLIGFPVDVTHKQPLVPFDEAEVFDLGATLESDAEPIISSAFDMSCFSDSQIPGISELDVSHLKRCKRSLAITVSLA